MNVTHYRLEVRASSIDRRGCFAGEAMPAGVVFREYEGEAISQAEARRREAGPSRTAIYTLWLDNGMAIDGFVGGNETIYLNHACQPNCEVVEEAGRAFFATVRSVVAGEDLTIDYAYDQATPLEVCRCGGERCRGYMNALPD